MMHSKISFLDLPCLSVARVYGGKTLGDATLSWENCGLHFTEPSEHLTWIRKQIYAAFLGNKPYLSFHLSADRGRIICAVAGTSKNTEALC